MYSAGMLVWDRRSLFWIRRKTLSLFKFLSFEFYLSRPVSRGVDFFPCLLAKQARRRRLLSFSPRSVECTYSSDRERKEMGFFSTADSNINDGMRKVKLRILSSVEMKEKHMRKKKRMLRKSSI